MRTIALWALLILALLSFFSGVTSTALGRNGGGAFLWGLGWLGLAAVLIVTAATRLRQEQIVDEWSTLIENGQGKADTVMQETESFVAHSQAPDVRLGRRWVSASTLTSLYQQGRQFLVVTETQNSRLAPYEMFINCQDYGNNLTVNWYLTFRPSLWRVLPWVLFGSIGLRNPLLSLDLFAQQDLRAYVTNAHRCLMKSVVHLMVTLNQDASSLDRKSRGFLGIS